MVSLNNDSAYSKLFNGGATSNEAIRRRSQHTPEQTVDLYDQWVENGTYEMDVETLCYRGHQVTAKTVAKMFPKERKNIHIVDIAAGTGLLAIELKKYGFEKFDAVDPSSQSKQLAMKAKLYKRYVLDYIGNGPLDVETDEYDCAVSSGGFGPGLMPCIAIQEFIRVVKPGGYVCFSVPEYIFRLSEEHRNRFEPLMEEYVKLKFWERISKDLVEDYLDEQSGVVFVFRVLKSEPIIC